MVFQIGGDPLGDHVDLEVERVDQPQQGQDPGVERRVQAQLVDQLAAGRAE
jgi:hypothetical protein